MTASLRVSYTLSGISSISAYLTSDITDTSSLFLGTAIDPLTGNIINVQTSPDVVRNKTARFNYTRNGSTVTTNLWVELRNVDYSTVPQDSEIREYGATLGYKVNSNLTASVNGDLYQNQADRCPDLPEHPAPACRSFVPVCHARRTLISVSSSSPSTVHRWPMNMTNSGLLPESAIVFTPDYRPLPTVAC